MIVDFFSFGDTVAVHFETKKEADAISSAPYKLAIFAHKRGFKKIQFMVKEKIITEFLVRSVLQLGGIDPGRLVNAKTQKGSEEVNFTQSSVRVVDFGRQA